MSIIIIIIYIYIYIIYNYTDIYYICDHYKIPMIIYMH